MRLHTVLCFDPINALKYNIKDLKDDIIFAIENNDFDDLFQQILDTNGIREKNDPDLLDSLSECMYENISVMKDFITEVYDIEEFEFEAEDFITYIVEFDLNFNGLCRQIFHQTIKGGK